MYPLDHEIFSCAEPALLAHFFPNASLSALRQICVRAVKAYIPCAAAAIAFAGRCLPTNIWTAKKKRLGRRIFGPRPEAWIGLRYAPDSMCSLCCRAREKKTCAILWHTQVYVSTVHLSVCGVQPSFILISSVQSVCLFKVKMTSDALKVNINLAMANCCIRR